MASGCCGGTASETEYRRRGVKLWGSALVTQPFFLLHFKLDQRPE
uniref:Uncharacterized protein n=1 Tax=Anguilla anguilla TaxID=7936 RepID=A0A0E9W5B2_ANGAN